MLRAVLDTNILISAYIWPGLVSNVLYAAEAKSFRIIVSEAILAEFRRVLSRDKFTPRFRAVQTTPEIILDRFIALVEFVEPIALSDVPVRDPKDVMLLECAVAGNVDYLVSGDKDLTDLGESFPGVKIVKPAAFLAILGQDPSQSGE